MSIIPTWPIAAGVLVVGLAVGAAADHVVMDAKLSREEARYTKLVADHTEQERQRAEQRSRDEREAREKEQTAAREAAKREQEKTDAYARVSAERDDAVKRLQQRPDRKPAPAGGVPAATPACAGTSGAELSRQDAEFLVGEAARADRLRAALTACYGVYDAAQSQQHVNADQGNKGEANN